MELTLGIILIAFIQFLIMAFKVGAARGEFDVPAPKIQGADLFERRFRIHQNTMEQLVVFVPSVLIFSFYICDVIAASLGVLFVVSRQWYSHLYMTDPTSRGKGFLVAFGINSILIVAGLIALGLTFFK